MSVSDTRRAWRNQANGVGFTVLGLNGEVRRGFIVGSAHDRNSREDARVFVDDEFAFFQFPIKWKLVKAIADGYVSQIRIRPSKGISELRAKLARQESNLQPPD